MEGKKKEVTGRSSSPSQVSWPPLSPPIKQFQVADGRDNEDC